MSWLAPVPSQVRVPPAGLPLTRVPITERGAFSSTEDPDLDPSRLGRLAAFFGCPADVEAITLAVLQQTALGDDAGAAVRTTVDHLVRHDLAWRSMVRGVVPPSLRAQALAVTCRTSPTDPADSVPAVVLAAVGEAVSNPVDRQYRDQTADLPTRVGGAPARQLLSSILAGLFPRLRTGVTSRVRRPGGASVTNTPS